MHPSVAKLIELMPPRPGAGDAIDWDHVAEHTGKRFPSDYRDFVAHYGAGSLNNSFWVGIPIDDDPGPWAPSTLTSLTDHGFGLLRLKPGDDPDLTERISWATDSSANHAFWDTADPDPDSWPVLVLARYGDWFPYNGGMADFLVDLITNPDEMRMGVMAAEEPVFSFIHWREEQRLREAGEDPWTHLD
ncbi:hypothetical protein ACH4E7_45370 [Kitasatospora sp. NPDC018058]|uniref:hypothetical protein n=1 Tax=Kitasatospora sp. NPDC018058 TaxID=3364025 RepID=UPI0037C0C072